MLSEQQEEFVRVLAVGCHYETAAAIAGLAPDELLALIRTNREFASRAARMSGLAEVAHLGNVKRAATDPKNWRASAWWLEHRFPDKYGKRNPQAILPQQFQQLLEEVIRAVVDEVHDPGDRQRLSERLQNMIPPEADGE